MTFMLQPRSDEDITTETKPTGRYTFGERLNAQAEETRILKDLNDRSGTIDKTLEQSVIDQLGPRLDVERPDPRKTPYEQRHNWLLDVVRRAQDHEPERFGHLPSTIEDWDASVMQTRRAELDEARAVLDGSDGWTAELLGDLWAEVSTPEGAMMLTGGASGGARIITTMLLEGGLAALDEVRTLDDQYQVANELGEPEPRPFLQTGVAFAVGSGLGGILSGAQRFIEYRVAKGKATGEQRPSDVSPAKHERQVQDERARLEQDTPAGLNMGQDIAADPAVPATTTPPRMADFDFTPAGNASPQTNRIGYVFGKLIELGYEPHIAAGLTGNVMQESGVGINTRAVGDNGNAFGMAQWNGPRRRAYLRYAQASGKQPDDIDTQIAFLQHELTHTEQSAAAKILAAPDARAAAAIASNEFWRPGVPHLSRRMAYAGTIMEQFDTGGVPRWQGAIAPGQDSASGFAGYGTSRGFTGSGQIAVGEDLRIDVDYEVVDASLLEQASGNLQPRDRNRIASDAWVNDTAARLDPALLMPVPTADRGTPLVGPDNVIESGNGRVQAINRAYDQFPDRADAYRQQIETTTGKPIPEGVERPVLIARRTSDLTPQARRQMVIDAQDSGVARMNATERAQIGQRALNADVLAKHRPGTKLSAAGNRDFARSFAGHFPRSERGAFVGSDGRISADGIRQIQDSLFARAWDAPDIIARALEAEPGDMKSLFDALADAAPEVAALRADIDAGLVRPEMDITPFVLDATRLIATARELADRGGQVAEILEELLAEVDLLDGAIAPLTQAIVRLMMPNGRLAGARRIAGFLKRYAVEARKAGQAGDAFEPVGPLDVLKRLDADAFGDLSEIGALRSEAEQAPPPIDRQGYSEGGFADGAASPEAEAADDLAEVELQAATETIDDVLMRGGSVEELSEHPELAPVLREMETRERTDLVEGYGTEEYWRAREYVAGDRVLVGKSAAVDYLYGEARSLAWTDEGLAPPKSIASERQATILIGAPAAGKSSIANPWARAKRAVIVDADEAKKVMPEYDGGIGANAVHEESADLSAAVLIRAIEAGDNLVLPKVGSAPGSIARLVGLLHQGGYNVDLALVDVAPAESWARMLDRFRSSGRLIPPAILDKGIDGAPRTYETLKQKGIADGYAKIDNSPPPGAARGIVEDAAGIVPDDVRGNGAERHRTDETAERGADSQRADGRETRQESLSNDLEIELADGTTVSGKEFLDDLDADEKLDAAIDACTLGGAG